MASQKKPNRKKPNRKKQERGAAMLEFIFAGVPLIFLIVVMFEICLAMWSYHSLATAVEDGAIYASTKGQGCTYTGNSCRVSVSQVVQDILSAGPGINSSQLSITLHSSGAGTTDVTCNPASNCLTGTYTTQIWPPGKVSSGPPAVYGDMPDINYIDVTGSYPSPLPVTNLFWPTKFLGGLGTLQFSATSRQVIQY